MAELLKDCENINKVAQKRTVTQGTHDTRRNSPLMFNTLNNLHLFIQNKDDTAYFYLYRKDISDND